MKRTRGRTPGPGRAGYAWLAALIAVLAVLLLLAMPGFVGAQGAINVTINDVDTGRFPQMVTYVTIVDDKGRTVVELAPSAFSLAEDGTPIRDFDVAMMENAGAPILLALALDTSGSMKGTAMVNTKSAATQLVRDLGPADKVAVLSFADEVATHQEFSTDKDAAAAAVDALEVAGDTALHDAILRGVELLDAQPRGRKALVVLTDGEDTASQAAMAQAIEAARLANVPVYAIGFGPSIKPAVLDELAIETGGHFYRTPDSDEVDDSFEAVARLLRYQYVIQYESALPADGAEHALLVTVEVEGLPSASGEAAFVAQPGEVRVRLQGLSEGDTVGGLVTLKPVITSPGSVVQVDYLLDGARLDSATTGEFAIAWDASEVPLGEHTLTVRAIDSAGNKGETELALNVVEAIVVGFRSPTGDRPVGGQVPVEVDVTSLAGVAQVKFAVDGQEVAAVEEPPWAFTWDTAPLEVTTHTLLATAYDAKGLTAEASQDLWVGMKLKLKDMADGDSAGGLWALAPEIVAPADPAQVEYLLDEALLATMTAPDLAYEWDATAAPLGEHTLGMRVTDSAGNVGHLDLTLTVTEPLEVAIVLPSEERLQDLGREEQVEARVVALQEVDRVEFAVDGQVIETVKAAPYRFLWDTTAHATGEHTLSATAYDVLGQSDQESLDVWVAFRGPNLGLWVALVVLIVGVGLAIPVALRRRQKVAGALPPDKVTVTPDEPLPPGMQPVAWLVVEQGAESGRRWPVPQGETTLGRHSTANDIVIPSRQASRRHSAIRADAEGCVYYDVEPTNPTLINDEALVGSHELVEGDRLLIGDVVLRYTKEGTK